MENELKPCAYNEKLVRLKDVNDALTAQFMDSPLDSDRWVIGRIQFRINDIPAVDAVEVRHGEWKPTARYSLGFSECSVCGYETLIKSNYCPNCGARMDGRREDGDA